MPTRNFSQGWLLTVLFVCLGVVPLSSIVAETRAADLLMDTSLGTRLLLAQNRQCERRVGPHATQSTAMQRRREFQNRGVAVSDGVYICNDHTGARGYCFSVFTPC